MPIALHMLAGWTLVLATFAMIGFYIPPEDATIGASYLIFFVHFPSAICSLLLFVAAGVASVVYLAKGRPGADLWAAAAVEVGVLACTVTLVTGSIWAKAAWGIWWDNGDPRLMTVAIMWLTYLAYLVLRGTLEEPVRRARFSAVFAILATINVPLVFFAIRIFRQVHHPMAVSLKETEMVLTRWFGALAFLVLYAALGRLRFRLAREQFRSRLLEEGCSRAGI